MKTTNHECHVSFEVAKLLKDAGFDWKVTCWYEILRDGSVIDSENFEPYFSNWNNSKYSKSTVSMPTLDVAQRWLREIKNIAVYACPSYEPIGNDAEDKWIMRWQVAATHYDIEADEIDLGDVLDETFDTYEEALEAGIKKTLEIILEL